LYDIIFGRAIAECLTAEYALDNFFLGDCIADILNQTAGLEERAALSAESIAKAFKGGDGGDDLEGVGKNDILCVFRTERSIRSDKAAIAALYEASSHAVHKISSEINVHLLLWT
jgi:hypothetical protein